ncbi:DUF1853 family protein [Aquimarina mytili]|uniref:DUF1853 family protein n=1 Tax=Aquimarina mytili TaxID=874423 RepID=A0A936ZU86_9FLAO|nr:DUF1853 family protein [Aquimarina mytili]MBL0684412.1 DUF1853 family protein [Aquimarina mytili]
MAILKQQYAGFLNSAAIHNFDSFLGLALFDFNVISKSSLLPNSINLTISDNEVLGKRIEHFFEYCVSASQNYQIIAKNIQIFKQKITIGELDFLIKDLIKEEILHIELIYKFYVYDPDINEEMHRWIGPNRKDSLLQKIEKLKNKQFPLLYKNETKEVLKELNIELNRVKQQACYLVNLFVPYSLKHETFTYINNDCIIGYWIKFKDFNSKRYTSKQFHIPIKQNWIVNPKYCDTWFSYDDIYKQLHLQYAQKKSPLLWMNNGDGSFERFFVAYW